MDDLAALQFLKSSTNRGKVLHDSQVFQLKAWGNCIYLDAVCRKVEVKFREDDDAVQFVVFYLEGPPELPTENYLTQCENSVKWLLGDDWEIAVYYNSENIY